MHSAPTDRDPQAGAQAAPAVPLWQRRAWMLSPGAWTLDTAYYLSYRVADYVVLNLGEDAAMVAFMFC
jgi:hypothetical protein